MRSDQLWWLAGVDLLAAFAVIFASIPYVRDFYAAGLGVVLALMLCQWVQPLKTATPGYVFGCLLVAWPVAFGFSAIMQSLHWAVASLLFFILLLLYFACVTVAVMKNIKPEQA